MSLVTQGRHRFYTLTMPSDVLAKTCFYSPRYDDPDLGFQCILEKKRPVVFAAYIDTGLGTIPSSIVLSAQPDAELRVIGKGKTIEFQNTRKTFLILDGQHRVTAFQWLRPASVFPLSCATGSAARMSHALFIDMNTKQRPVPKELLLDIKKLAEYESEVERRIGEVFDLFPTRIQPPDRSANVAISNGRLVEIRDGQVTFRWRDSADGNRQPLMTLDGVESCDGFCSMRCRRAS